MLCLDYGGQYEVWHCHTDTVTHIPQSFCRQHSDNKKDLEIPRSVSSLSTENQIPQLKWAKWIPWKAVTKREGVYLLLFCSLTWRRNEIKQLGQFIYLQVILFKVMLKSTSKIHDRIFLGNAKPGSRMPPYNSACWSESFACWKGGISAI